MVSGAVDTLQANYGGRIPTDEAEALHALDQSPLAPSDPTAKANLREAVLAHLGERIDGLRAAFEATTAHARANATEHRAAGGQLAARLQANASANADANANVNVNVNVNASVSVPSAATKAPKLQRAISEARVRELYDIMAAAPDIPHHFVDDGCMFRAHVIAKRLEEAGVFSEKIIHQTTGGDLKINSDKAAIGFTLAMFHIATAVYVKTEGGSIERRVIDPSLCDGPATPELWASHMEAVGGADCVTSYAPRFCLMPYDRENPPTTWKQRDLDDAREWNVTYKEVQQHMIDANFYDHLKELVADPPGG